MSAVTSNIFFIQAIGFVAFVFGVAAFLSHDDRKLKILLTVQSYALSVHFLLLGANGAVVTTFIAGTRNLVSLFAKVKFFAPLFVALYIIFGIYYYEKWTDILPVTSGVITTMGIFYLERIPMRLAFLCASSLWIVHNILVMSIGPLLMELFILTVNIRTIRTLHRLKRYSNCSK